MSEGNTEMAKHRPCTQYENAINSKPHVLSKLILNLLLVSVPAMQGRLMAKEPYV